MKNIFEPDSRWNVYLSKAYDLFILNMLWLLCSLPVVTMGAANTALYYAGMKMAKKTEGNIVKAYMHSFKQNLKQGILLQVLFLILFFPLAYSVYLAAAEGAALFKWLCILSAVLLSAVFSYAYPLLAGFDNTIRNTLANAAKLAVLYPKTTLRILLVNFSPLLFAAVWTGLFMRSFLLWAAFVPALPTYINSRMLLEIFEDLGAEKDRQPPGEEAS